MWKTRLTAINWLYQNIGSLKATQLLLSILFGIKKEYLIEFYFEKKRARFIISSRRTELAGLTEVFCFEVYQIKSGIQPELIIDGGANKGYATVYFGLKYPNAVVHCYEPNISLIPALKRNIELNNIRAKIFKVALSDRKGYSYFEVGVNHQYSRLAESSTVTRVKTISLNKRYFGQKIDILKLDIEGAEEKVIPSLDYSNISIGLIIQEIHHHLAVDFENIKKVLLANNFLIEDPYPQYRLLNDKTVHPILVAIHKR